MNWKVSLWDGIHEYVRACGGDPSRMGQTIRKEAAVVTIERLFENLAEDNKILEIRLIRIAKTIYAVDERCMAADGPVTPTKNEITTDEIRYIYRMAGGNDAAEKDKVWREPCNGEE